MGDAVMWEKCPYCKERVASVATHVFTCRVVHKEDPAPVAERRARARKGRQLEIQIKRESGWEPAYRQRRGESEGEVYRRFAAWSGEGWEVRLVRQELSEVVLEPLEPESEGPSRAVLEFAETVKLGRPPGT